MFFDIYDFNEYLNVNVLKFLMNVILKTMIFNGLVTSSRSVNPFIFET